MQFRRLEARLPLRQHFKSLFSAAYFPVGTRLTQQIPSFWTCQATMKEYLVMVQ
jgi:hypothetical protein